MNIPQFARTAAALMTVTAIASASPVPVPSQFAMNSGGFRAGSGDSDAPGHASEGLAGLGRARHDAPHLDFAIPIAHAGAV